MQDAILPHIGLVNPFIGSSAGTPGSARTQSAPVEDLAGEAGIGAVEVHHHSELPEHIQAGLHSLGMLNGRT
jgi:hypothetical protein